MSAPGGRPRWSFTWLVRIQRISRDRHEREMDAQTDRRAAMWHALAYTVIGVVLALEIALGFWLGILPR